MVACAAASRRGAPWASALARPESLRARFCAIAAALAIAGLAGCSQLGGPREPPPAPPIAQQPPAESPGIFRPYGQEQPGHLRLRHQDGTRTPARVALLLPFKHPDAATRAIAEGMLKAAQLALFEAGDPGIVLMPRDEGTNETAAAAAAEQVIAEGAEIILGPLFSSSVAGVAPVARARFVPVIAFSTDRAVAGGGVYLLSFQPEDEVRRIVRYAAQRGRASFAAMVPATGYGDKVANAFYEEVARVGGAISAVERFEPRPEAINEPARRVAGTGADAILLGEGGVLLRGLAPTLALYGVDHLRVKFLGTGLWDDPSIAREPMLSGGWFAAPAPETRRAFADKFAAVYAATPPRLASLAYDATAMVALLAGGAPYQRFTDAALTDPNGFAGADGIFRLMPGGATERGLAIVEVNPAGFTVVDPAPSTFERLGF